MSKIKCPVHVHGGSKCYSSRAAMEDMYSMVLLTVPVPSWLVMASARRVKDRQPALPACSAGGPTLDSTGASVLRLRAAETSETSQKRLGRIDSRQTLHAQQPLMAYVRTIWPLYWQLRTSVASRRGDCQSPFNNIGPMRLQLRSEKRKKTCVSNTQERPRKERKWAIQCYRRHLLYGCPIYGYVIHCGLQCVLSTHFIEACLASTRL